MKVKIWEFTPEGKKTLKSFDGIVSVTFDNAGAEITFFDKKYDHIKQRIWFKQENSYKINIEI